MKLIILTYLLLLTSFSYGQTTDVNVGSTRVITLRGKDSVKRESILQDRLRFTLNSKLNFISFSKNKNNSYSIYCNSEGQKSLLLTVTSEDSKLNKIPIYDLTLKYAIEFTEAISNLSPNL